MAVPQPLPRRGIAAAAAVAALLGTDHSAAWAAETEKDERRALGKLWEQADGRLGEALVAEDKELERASEEIRRDKTLEGQSDVLQEREQAVIRNKDEDGESKLEAEEEELQARITQAEERLGKEAANLEKQREQLLREEGKILQKVQEIQRREQEVLDEQARLERNKESLIRSESRLQESLRSRRDRAPRLDSAVSFFQQLFEGAR